MWLPLTLTDDRRNRFLPVIARLKPGVSLARATGYLKTVASRLAVSYPQTNGGRSVQLRTLREEIGPQGAKQEALIVFWLVGCVLLLACSNVANLVVGRAVARQKEMAVRLAIGAGRGRLLRQLLTENLALFLMAAVRSALFAAWGVRWIAQAIPSEVRGIFQTPRYCAWTRQHFSICSESRWSPAFFSVSLPLFSAVVSTSTTH